MDSNEKKHTDKEVFDIYKLSKIIEKNLDNNCERPKPFEDEGAYAEDDE